MEGVYAQNRLVMRSVIGDVSATHRNGPRRGKPFDLLCPLQATRMICSSATSRISGECFDRLKATGREPKAPFASAGICCAYSGCARTVCSFCQIRQDSRFSCTGAGLICALDRRTIANIRCATGSDFAICPRPCSCRKFLLVARLVDRQRNGIRSQRNGPSVPSHGVAGVSESKKPKSPSRLNFWRQIERTLRPESRLPEHIFERLGVPIAAPLEA
jgi:hypothetical protein